MSNFGVTVCAELIVTTQVAAKPHPPPLQPEKVEAAEAGVAVSVTVLPLR